MIEFHHPPVDVSPWVSTFFHLQCDRARIEDVQPATMPMVLVVLEGKARLQIRGGDAFDSHRASLITSLSAAAPIVIEGPWHAFGAMITPLGWAALTGARSASQWANRMVEAGSLMGPEMTALGEYLAHGHRTGMLDTAGMAAQMARVLRQRAMPVVPRHGQAIRAVADWLGASLSPRLEDLVALTPYSARQMQRLVDHYYGLGPKLLAHKYRALRAAALLCHPQTPAVQIAHVAEQFYDQSHMIREIRLFAGCTPGQLTRADHPVMAAALDLRNYSAIGPKVAAMPPGLGLP